MKRTKTLHNDFVPETKVNSVMKREMNKIARRMANAGQTSLMFCLTEYFFKTPTKINPFTPDKILPYKASFCYL
jgi:hypothetical protein